MRITITLVLAVSSTLAYGQLGAAAGGFAQAQQQDLERKHQLEMQREADQTALEIARIQAQKKAAQIAQPQTFLWESGNAFLQVCAGSFDRADSPTSQTDTEVINGVACMSFLRGLDEGVNFGIQFADMSTKQQSPSPWCTPDNVTAVQGGRILVKYIRAHPETSNQRTSVLALYAYRDAFPCQATQTVPQQ
jgi:hypothetical protein